MRVSFDDNYLITAGKDGCIILFDIKVKFIKNRIKKLEEVK